MTDLYDYSKYSYFGHLCQVPLDVLNNLQLYFDKVKNTKPEHDLGHYKQWYIQTSKIVKEEVEIAWTNWQDNNELQLSKEFFIQFVTKIYKFRFSYLDKNNQVDYHTKHMLPRIHIPLCDDASVFILKDNYDKEHEFKMEYGNAYFVNVTHYHKVVATKNIDRLNSFFCFTHFNEKYKELFVK